MSRVYSVKLPAETAAALEDLLNYRGKTANALLRELVERELSQAAADARRRFPPLPPRRS